MAARGEPELGELKTVYDKLDTINETLETGFSQLDRTLQSMDEKLDKLTRERV